MKHKLVIEEGGKMYNTFIVGFTSDGGFFIQDLFSTTKDYLIFKMRAPADNKVGMFYVRMDDIEYWKTKIKPKFTHHYDGNAHISGTNIISGYDRNSKKTKGVANKSVNLQYKNNDGGPYIKISFWGLNLFTQKNEKKKNVITFSKNDCLIDYINPPETKYAYNFSFYFLPRKALDYLNLSTGNIPFNHPNYGIIPLKYLPTPSHVPGILGISFKKCGNEWDPPCGFTLNGAPGTIDPNKTAETINIIYPYFDPKSKVKKLEYNGVNKIKILVKNYIDNILKKLKN